MSADLKPQLVVVWVIVHGFHEKKKKEAQTEGPVWVCTSWTYLWTHLRILGFLPLLQCPPRPVCLLISTHRCGIPLVMCYFCLCMAGNRQKIWYDSVLVVFVGLKQGNLFCFFSSVFAVSSASSGVGARLSSGRIEYQQRWVWLWLCTTCNLLTGCLRQDRVRY